MSVFCMQKRIVYRNPKERSARMNKLLCNFRCNQAICKLSEGDMTSLAVLYDCMSRQMYALALSILKNTADAEDALQETFVKVVQRIDTYREGGNARAWLLSITRNVAIDMVRKRKTTVSVEDPTVLETVASYEDPAQKLSIDEALMRLSQTDREIVVQKAVWGMRFGEIAELVGMQKSAVEKRYHRALAKLKSYLE